LNKKVARRFTGGPNKTWVTCSCRTDPASSSSKLVQTVCSPCDKYRQTEADDRRSSSQKRACDLSWSDRRLGRRAVEPMTCALLNLAAVPACRHRRWSERPVKLCATAASYACTTMESGSPIRDSPRSDTGPVSVPHDGHR